VVAWMCASKAQFWMKILEAVSKLNFRYERLKFSLVFATKAALKLLLRIHT